MWLYSLFLCSNIVIDKLNSVIVFTYFVVCEWLSQIVHSESELFFGYKSISIPVKDPEGMKNVLFNTSITSKHHLDEFVEVDGIVTVFVNISDHVLQIIK